MIQAVFPASFAQQRLWFSINSSLGTAAYNLLALRITGPLNVEVLERAFEMVIEATLPCVPS